MLYNKQTSNGVRVKTFLIFFIFLIGVIIFYFGTYSPRTPGSQEEVVFSIRKGEGTKDISHNLEREGLIRVGPLFRVYALLRGVSGKLQAGDYLLSPSMTIAEITNKIVSGDVIKEKITIIEGWNLEEITQYLEEKGFLEEEFLELVKKDFSKEFSFLEDKPKTIDLEGYLFPDTYYVSKQRVVNDERLEDLVIMMLDNFDKKLTQDLREEIIDNQGKTIFEIITMASLIEKEVQTLEDKKIVSGILWNRLDNNIPLQVDATITYLTGKKNSQISKEETQIDSLYNTYKYRGLPLGPISNPGLESIIASIYPESSDYWYYLSTPDGKIIFSKTLEEHNLAKAKYLK